MEVLPERRHNELEREGLCFPESERRCGVVKTTGNWDGHGEKYIPGRMAECRPGRIRITRNQEDVFRNGMPSRSRFSTRKRGAERGTDRRMKRKETLASESPRTLENADSQMESETKTKSTIVP